MKPGQSFSQQGKPIIIVPASYYQGNLCLGNALDFLQRGQYVPVQAQESGGKMEVSHVLCGETVAFEVMDNVLSFDAKQWARVVAVFVNGHDWQFKDWPTKKMVELFLRFRGYFLHFQDQTALPEIIGKWNIKTLTLQRNKRHQDVTVMNEFWTDLEAFMRKERFQIPGSSF